VITDTCIAGCGGADHALGRVDMSSFVSKLIGFASKIAGNSGFLSDVLNDFAINRLINVARNRPHPWSTRSPYISWSGLTDRSYSARLLPAKIFGPLRDAGDIVPLFAAIPGKQRPCDKSTALFSAFAQYLTDGFIRTKLSNDPPFGDGKKERKRTTTNHEIDQSPLYGRTERQTDVLRLKSSEVKHRGRLKSQIIDGEEYALFLFNADLSVKSEFCDPKTGDPILDLPLGIDKQPKDSPIWAKLFAVGGDRVNSAPQVAMMNTLFLREHNRLADMLERKHPAWDDDQVFETARNILIVMFIKIIVEEYINHISQAPIHLRVRPNVAWKARWNRPNWITAEFSLLYRWHPLVAETMKWGGKNLPGLALLLNNQPLLDAGLANAFADMSANNAMEVGLGNTAQFIMFAEEHAIAQARENQIAPYNDYREVMGMPRAISFDDVVGRSNDATEQERRDVLAARLQTLYGSVDKLEFYVGLFAEPTQTNGVLPDLLQAMVAMDAFSQALTNPLLSEHIWGDEANQRLTFTDEGLAEIEATATLRDIVARNSVGLGDRFVGMTRQDWRRS
jgi:prostaglandin-endoperoxide synthase 2